MGNINWTKVGKLGGMVLTIAGGIITSVVSAKENKKATIETTEKLFREYVEKK